MIGCSVGGEGFGEHARVSIGAGSVVGESCIEARRRKAARMQSSVHMSTVFELDASCARVARVCGFDGGGE